jgi:hypothetical protein
MIRPVDMQVMLQRAPEVNRVTNNDGSRAETQNNQFAEQFQRLSEQSARQVTSTHQTEGQDVDPDGRGAQDERRRRRRPGSTENQEDEKKNTQIKQGMLDIRI